MQGWNLKIQMRESKKSSKRVLTKGGYYCIITSVAALVSNTGLKMNFDNLTAYATLKIFEKTFSEV